MKPHTREILECEVKLNQILKMYLDSGFLIVLKTCQKEINNNGKLRPGRFHLDKDTHDLLTHKNGYYLFLVKDKNIVIDGRLYEANDINFAKVIQWKGFFT